MATGWLSLGAGASLRPEGGRPRRQQASTGVPRRTLRLWTRLCSDTPLPPSPSCSSAIAVTTAAVVTPREVGGAVLVQCCAVQCWCSACLGKGSGAARPRSRPVWPDLGPRISLTSSASGLSNAYRLYGCRAPGTRCTCSPAAASRLCPPASSAMACAWPGWSIEPGACGDAGCRHTQILVLSSCLPCQSPLCQEIMRCF